MTTGQRELGSFPRSDFDAVIIDIAQDLMPSLRADQRPAVDALPGAALFYSHLAVVSGSAKYAKAAAETAGMLSDCIAQLPLRPYLYSGVAGMAFPVAHMQRLGIGDDSIDLSSVDDLLLDCIGAETTPLYDLIAGVVGLGVYFIERLPAPAATIGVRAVISRLRATAEQGEWGCRWFTPPALVPPIQRDGLPNGKYDLGMAHGVPGIIAFLALALLEGIDRQPAEELLRQSVNWLLSLEREDTGNGAYGTVVDPRDPQMPLHKRAAWCYGDPGIAIALFLASRALDDETLRVRAHRLARSSAVFADQERDRVVDMSLCHGSAGLAHIFGILSNAFGDTELRTRSNAWHATTLELRRPGEGIAGFYYSQWVAESNRRRVIDRSFLQGVSGVGLSLLNATSDDRDRSWDRLLLLS